MKAIILCLSVLLVITTVGFSQAAPKRMPARKKTTIPAKAKIVDTALYKAAIKTLPFNHKPMENKVAPKNKSNITKPPKKENTVRKGY